MKVLAPAVFIAFTVSLLGVACVHTVAASHPRCWDDAGNLIALRSEAMFAVSERVGPDADRLRTLAGVGTDTTKVERQLQVVTDDAICARAGAAFNNPKPGGRFAVVHLGHAYWVRSSVDSGALALDDRFVIIMRIVDI